MRECDDFTLVEDDLEKNEPYVKVICTRNFDVTVRFRALEIGSQWVSN